jgi:hypothetical protein
MVVATDSGRAASLLYFSAVRDLRGLGQRREAGHEDRKCPRRRENCTADSRESYLRRDPLFNWPKIEPPPRRDLLKWPHELEGLPRMPLGEAPEIRSHSDADREEDEAKGNA